MNLKEYQQAALRTESIKEKLEFNSEYINALLQIFVYSAEALDAVKKEIYYGNPKKTNEKMEQFLVFIQNTVSRAKWAFVSRNQTTVSPINPRVFHGIIGVATEAGELVSALEKALDDGKIDAVNIQEEMGDGAGGAGSWYAAILHDALGLDPEVTMEKNIAKLRARYPEKFTEHHAEIRDLEAEREILEGK